MNAPEQLEAIEPDPRDAELFLANTFSYSQRRALAEHAYQRTRRGIARSFQIPRPFATMSVLENLVVPLEYVVHRGSLHTADTRGEAMEILRGMGLADKADLRLQDYRDVFEQTVAPYPSGDPVLVFAGSPLYDSTIRFIFDAMQPVWDQRPEGVSVRDLMLAEQEQIVEQIRPTR